MDAILVYEVIHDHVPEQPGDIAITVGDFVEVERQKLSAVTDYRSPNVWLTGKNRRTGNAGEFPGTYVRYVSISVTNDATGDNDPDDDEGESPGDIYSTMDQMHIATVSQQRRHRLSTVYFVRPIICAICTDYIWGQGDVGVTCSVCRLCFHNCCAESEELQNHACRAVNEYTSIGINETCAVPVPLSSWTSTNVLEWMAAVNLYRYIELFKKRSISGEFLDSLSEDKLKELGIKDDFHRKALMVCIDELCGRVLPEKKPELSEPKNSRAFCHRLREHTFSSLQCCHICDKPLYGLLHQGLQCSVCGLCCHRQCRVGKGPACSAEKLRRIRRPSFVVDPVFGEELGKQFPLTGKHGAPAVLIVCCGELERRAKENKFDVIDSYRTTPLNESVNKLKKFFDQSAKPHEIELDGFDNSTIAGTVKKYLRELPNSLIPVEFYEPFIEAAKLEDETVSQEQLSSLVNQLPPHHHSVLEFMMAHFCRVCIMLPGSDRPTRLGIVFCHILLRPAWEKIIEIVGNTEFHLRVFERLLCLGLWGVDLKGAPPPTAPVRPLPRPAIAATLDPGTLRLEDADWYWGDVSREEVNERLNDSPDGSFLIRIASTNATHGDFTLTLRKGGTNKLIKIYHRNNKFGFVEPYLFNSIVELVNHFRTHSLAEYNRSLDTTLKYPISRKEMDDECLLITPPHAGGSSGLLQEHVGSSMFEQLKQINREYLEQTLQFDRLSGEQSKLTQDIQMRYQALEAFKETKEVFEEQIKLAEQYQSSAATHELSKLRENFELLGSRLTSIIDSKERLEESVKEQAQRNHTLIADLNSLKPEIRRKHKLREQCIKSLMNRGMSKNQIDQVLEEQEKALDASTDNPKFTDSGKQSTPPPHVTDNEEFIPHGDDTTWFIRCDRREAERMLAGKQDGAFLVRESAQKGCYALSIMAKGVIGHCIIKWKPTGFGFAEPYLIHESLMSLVLHYREVSLAEHNEELDVRLSYPVKVAPLATGSTATLHR